MAFDAVVSIGGQSLVDGVWRLLGPALQGLTNPLPIVLPGFANAQMRVTQLVPLFPAAAPASGGLLLAATVELSGEALLLVTAAANTLSIGLGPGTIDLTSLTGTFDLPEHNATVTLPTGPVSLRLPRVPAPLTDGRGAGTITFPPTPTAPGLPIPAIVPVAVDLTATGPLPIAVTLTLEVINPSVSTRYGLLFRVAGVEVVPPAMPGFDAILTGTLQAAVDRITGPLDLPPALRPTVARETVAALLEPVPRLIASTLDDALTGLLAETGRLVYPPAGSGASCDVEALPTAASAQLSASTDGAYLLQIGFERPTSTDIAAFPPFTPSGAADCRVTIGNAFLLKLLCCLVEKLPAFSLPVAATTGTTDPAGGSHEMCCTFTNATVMLGGIAIGGGPGDFVSVCIDPAPAGSTAKPLSIVGSLTQTVALPPLAPPAPLAGLTPATIATVALRFTIPIAVDLDDVAALSNLREARVRAATPPAPPLLPTVTATVTPNTALISAVASLVAGVLVAINLLLFGLFAGVVAIAATALLTALFFIVQGVAEFLLTNAARTLVSAAALLRSPVAVPPGLFEAFGRFAPATVTIDDLTADGVLHTPTSPWGLLPRIGRRQAPPQEPVLTHVPGRVRPEPARGGKGAQGRAEAKRGAPPTAD